MQQGIGIELSKAYGQLRKCVRKRAGRAIGQNPNCPVSPRRFEVWQRTGAAFRPPPWAPRLRKLRMSGQHVLGPQLGRGWRDRSRPFRLQHYGAGG
jgi:hypothetical protein